jgi:hypothetical protein
MPESIRVGCQSRGYFCSLTPHQPLELAWRQRRSRHSRARLRTSLFDGRVDCATGNLGDRPLNVLTAGKPYRPDPLLTKEDMDKQNNVWINALQAEEAHLSTRGDQVVVSDSDHMIPFERPDTVIGAIREVWDALRSKKRATQEASHRPRQRANSTPDKFLTQCSPFV